MFILLILSKIGELLPTFQFRRMALLPLLALGFFRNDNHVPRAVNSNPFSVKSFKQASTTAGS